MKDFQLYWPEGGATPELEALVVEDLRRECAELKKAESLIVHTVFLSRDLHGPNIEVWGVEGDPRFHCRSRPAFGGMSFHIDEIPGFRDKLKAAGWKDPDDE